MFQGDSILPRPPSPSDFQAYGFAGIIFGSFFFIVVVGGFFIGRYINRRDELWAASQKDKDLLFKESLTALGASHEKSVASLGAAHEKVIERVAQSAERASEAATVASDKITTAVRELQKEVALGHQVFSEERITTALRRALREVKHEG